MQQFSILFHFGLKCRSNDFFVLFYNIVFPLVMILALGYLTSPSYGTAFLSYHYYTIVIIPFSALTGISTVSYAAQDEKVFRTAYRYLAAPINKHEIVLSKFASSAIVLSFCNYSTLLIAMVMFGFHFNFYILLVILLLTSETIAVTGIGLYLGLSWKNLDALRNYLNVPIVVFGFLGGVFFPVHSSLPVLNAMITLSPFTWINRGIASCLYDNQTDTIIIVSGALLVCGMVMVLLTICCFKKEVFLT